MVSFRYQHQLTEHYPPRPSIRQRPVWGLNSRSVWTDQDGRFSVVIPEGRWAVCVRHTTIWNAQNINWQGRRITVLAGKRHELKVRIPDREKAIASSILGSTN
ncbi:MAG: hypothetical protein IH991_13415 [Planctomycetes bacterium]|nr:hypothetical protein [Planctomycetota bacterium]